MKQKVKDLEQRVSSKMGFYCDICRSSSSQPQYDGKTILGPWAYMCEECFKTYGIGLGTGKGQKLDQEIING